MIIQRLKEPISKGTESAPHNRYASAPGLSDLSQVSWQVDIQWFWKHILGNCRRENTIGWLAPDVGILAATGPFARHDLFKGLPGFPTNSI
jgi:hypothetical protein